MSTSTQSLNLVNDETITLRAGKFRMQIWRAAGLTPVVLLIQLRGEPQPKYFVTRLAQMALQHYLGYSLPLPIVFCYGRNRGVPQATRVAFEAIGSPLRPILDNPKLVNVDPSVIARVFQLTPV